jgi:hypothetical protein
MLSLSHELAPFEWPRIDWISGLQQAEMFPYSSKFVMLTAHQERLHAARTRKGSGADSVGRGHVSPAFDRIFVVSVVREALVDCDPDLLVSGWRAAQNLISGRLLFDGRSDRSQYRLPAHHGACFPWIWLRAALVK